MTGGYNAIQKLLHWTVALLVLGSLGFGFTIWWYGFSGLVDAFGQATTNMIYKYHKTAGVIILGLMIARIAAKARYGKPAYDPPLKPWERSLSALSHHGLYVCLILMPVFGWLGTSAGGFPVEFFDWRLPDPIGKDDGLRDLFFQLHGITGFVTLCLVVMHVGGAMKHAIIDGDNVMNRML